MHLQQFLRILYINTNLFSDVTLDENLENGDFVLAKNNTKLKVNLTNKVIGQLLPNNDPKSDPRTKIKSLEIGGEFRFSGESQYCGERVVTLFQN